MIDVCDALGPMIDYRVAEKKRRFDPRRENESVIVRMTTLA